MRKSNTLAHFLAVFRAERGKGTVIERIADFLHQVIIKPQVMHDQQALRKHFPAFEQMAQVGAAKPAAGRTLAVRRFDIWRS